MTKENRNQVKRTSAGLRDALFDELDGLRSGKINATKANATAKIATVIIDTVNMELAVYKTLKVEGKAESLKALPSFELSND